MESLWTSAIVIPAQRSEHTFSRFEIACSEFEVSKRFWVQGLGFKEQTGCSRSASLHRTAALPQWRMEIQLSKTANPTKEYFLDSGGLNVLSFISNDVPADGLRLNSLGARAVSKVFNLQVNQRYLMVQLIRGPSGEMIELISV
jgi:hypothetical protein